MKVRSVVKGLLIGAGWLVWLTLLVLTLYGMTPGWLGLIAFALIPIVGLYMWIRDDIDSRPGPFRSRWGGGALSREEYMRPKPFLNEETRSDVP
jgi:hypothetical protein